MANARTTSDAEEYYSQTLYQKGARGETRVWRIWVTGTPGSADEDGVGVIHREHGTMGGKHTGTTRVIREGKNIGKKNETTPLDQAVAEAKSIATKKAREGYSPEESTRGQTSGDVILPMLAHDYHKQKKPLGFPCFAQPKLDGVRMVVEQTPEGLRMTTRTGKPVYFMDHIHDALVDILPVGTVLDGELFTPEKTFEEITGIVRKSVRDHHSPEEARVVQYHVFDIFRLGEDHMDFTVRNKLLLETLPMFADNDTLPIVIVPTKLLSNQEEANAIHETFTAEGHEGTMYRSPYGPYKIRLRSRDLLKRKDFQTEEYRIVGATQGVGKDIGTVIWTVETTPVATGAGDVVAVEHQTFSVRPRGSMEQRRIWWENRESYIGNMLTVRFQNLTEGGIPRFPVGLTIRDYE
jgi:DNA ligase-1